MVSTPHRPWQCSDDSWQRHSQRSSVDTARRSFEPATNGYTARLARIQVPCKTRPSRKHDAPFHLGAVNRTAAALRPCGCSRNAERKARETDRVVPGDQMHLRSTVSRAATLLGRNPQLLYRVA